MSRGYTQRVVAAIGALADIGYRGQTMQPVQRNRQRPIAIAQLGGLLVSPQLSGVVTGQNFIVDDGISRKMQYV